MSSPTDAIRRLPQEPPFLFLDEILELVPRHHAVGSKTFPPGDPIFDGHLPGEPLVPGVILIEALAQLSGVILMPAEEDAGAGTSSGYLAGVRQVRFRRRVHPGETITLRASLGKVLGTAGIFEVAAEVEGEEVLTGSLTLGGMASS